MTDDRNLMTRGLLAVVAVALLLRIVWAVLVPVVPMSDVMAYDTFSRNLAQHGVFGWTKDEPFAFWSPGTAFFYAAVYEVFGLSYLPVVVANLFVAVGLVVCTARVAERFYGPLVAVASAAVLAVWPTLVMFSTLLASEMLFLVLIMAALDVWTLRRGSLLARGLGAGVLLGAATLVRPLALLLPGVFAVSMLLHAGWQREHLRTQAVLAVLSTVVLLAVLAPWAWRNYQLYGELILVSTNGGATLWMGNRMGGDGAFSPLPESVMHLNDAERNKVLGAMAREYILSDPLGFVGRTLKKLVLLYSNESIGALWNADGITQRFGAGAVTWFKRFTQLSWAVIFIASLAGAWLIARRHGLWKLATSPLVLLAAYFSAVHSVIIIGDRYHLVAASQLAALAGFALAAWLGRHRQQVPAGAMARS